MGIFEGVYETFSPDQFMGQLPVGDSVINGGNGFLPGTAIYDDVERCLDVSP